MVEIISDVSLQEASLFGLMKQAAAIDEALSHMHHFRKMKMSWNLLAIRQNETRESAGLFVKDSN